MSEVLPVGTKVRIKTNFERNGEVGETVTPDFEAEIVEIGNIEESYTGLQSYVIKLLGLVPTGVNQYWWADATQFDVIEE